MQSRLVAYLLLACLLVTACGGSPSVTPAAESGVSTADAAVAAAPEMDRGEAINVLTSEAFLSFSNASCVVDAIHAEVGTYDFTQPQAVEGIDQPALTEACVSGDAPDSTSTNTSTTEDDSGQSAGPLELTDETTPALSPGAIGVGAVTLGGTEVDYVTITPPGFTIGDTAPVYLALPPGEQDLQLTENVADLVYRTQALERGWVVVSPASPGGRWWEKNNAALMPEMLRWIDAWVTVEGGRVHLGGMSNGGTSAFTIAAANPDDFASLMLYPGAPDVAATRGLDGLAMPVRMWVGGEDPDWVTPMETAAATIESAGGDVELLVVPGESHVIASITDGVVLFDALEAVR